MLVTKKCLIIIQGTLAGVATELFGNMAFINKSYYEQLLSERWTKQPAVTKAGYEGCLNEFLPYSYIEMYITGKS